ncbi:MAG: hypothetical protein NZV14_06790 [Bryobacteraceae bacterium]|nr:hypothetical protein [Bryobacteraceae bacterium]MDW8377849.1 hypothetical protein [Bryobacterales bacterium]
MVASHAPSHLFPKLLTGAALYAFFSFSLLAAMLDTDGMPLIQGKRTFLLGVYQLPNRPNAWQQAAAAGFQLVHVPAKREELDRAQKYGLRAWVTLGVIQPQTRTADQARIRRIVEDLRDHPALLFWETVDEPTYEWKKPGLKIPPEVVQETYRFVKALDPQRPLYLNHAPTNLVATLQRYNPGGDFIATDIYPVIPHGIREMYGLWPSGRQGDLLNTHISQVGQYALKMRQVAGPHRAVLMVLQGFAWERLRAKGQDPRMILEPTRDEQRFMAWQAVANGVNGILYWGLHTNPPASKLWDELCSVARELSSLEQELAARPLNWTIELEYHDTGHSLDRGIEYLLKPSAAGPVLIAVNADPNPVEVTFRKLPKTSSIKVLFESRSVVSQGDAFRDRFRPFDVHLYRLLPVR